MGVLPRVAATLAAVVIAHTVVIETGSRAAVVADELLVRIYDGVGVQDPVRKRALAGARDILTRVEVDVAWLQCPPGGLAWLTSACSAPPQPGDLIVRLARASSHVRRQYPHALGFSLVDTATGQGTLATVFTDRVELLAQRARIDRGAVLGRAIAHELGHLILGTNQHGASGLMRERWTSAELERDHPQDWQFTAVERQALHATLQDRAAAPRGPGGGRPNPHVLLDKTP